MKTSHSRFVFVALLGLSACGGGGGGGSGGGPLPAAPSNLVYSSSDRLEVSQVQIEPVTATVVGDVTQFTVVPPLPGGIVLDSLTGEITGTPTAPAPRRVYDVAASNAGGSAHFALTLQVVAAPRFMYATSSTDHSISFFADDLATGEITRAGQTILGGAESAPERLVFHPDGGFAYATNMATSNVSAFTVDPDTGWLDKQAAIACGTGPHELAIDPSGRYAYVTSRGSDQIHGYAIDQVSGALTLIEALGTSFQPSDVEVEPSGRLLFMTLRGREPDGLGSAVQGFFIDSPTGQIFPTGPELHLQGGRPISLCIDPVKPLMYVTLEAFDDALPIEYDPLTAALDPVALRHVGVMPVSIAVHVTGNFAYVINQSDSTISALSVDGTSFILQPVATYPTGTAPTSITMDPTGKFLYVAARDSAELLTYVVDPDTGVLTPAGARRLRGAPCNVVIGTGDHPTQKVPRFVHVAGRVSGDVTSYTIDAATGGLAQSGSTLTGNGPASIAIDPLQRFAWVANEQSSTISIHTLNPVTGALGGLVAAQPVTGQPTHVAVDPTARFLVSVAHDVVAPEDGWATAWSLDAATGALTLINALEVGPNPASIAIEPTGRFVYTANRGTSTLGTAGISVLAIDPQTGALSLSAPPAAAPGIVDISFHPDGYFAYGVLANSDAVARYSIDRIDGHLTVVVPGTPAGPEPFGLAFTPNGRFSYVASRGYAGSGNIALHSVASSGALGAAAQTLFDGTDPSAIAVDPTGRFVYAVNAGSDTISIAGIDSVTGAMTLAIPIATGVEPRAITVTGITQ